MARTQRIRQLAVGAALMLTAAFGWVSNANARSGFYDTDCAGCHGTNPDTCAGCHAHGAHSSSGRSDMNVSATSDKTVYAPGEMVNVAITGGYRPGWVRVKLWDKDCGAVSCSTNDYVEIQGTMATGISADFPGPATLSHPAPGAPGTYTWSASWYGNVFEDGGAFGARWLPDTGNFNHGDEIVTFTFEVASGNTSPVANADSVSTAVNSPLDIDVLANDTDADGDTLTVNSFDNTSANGGTVSCSFSATAPAPQCAYTPAVNACGADSFSYDATDGSELSNRATVTIQIGDANGPLVTAPTPDQLIVTLPAGTDPNTTVPATDEPIASWLASATADDPEEGPVAVSNNAPTAFPVGTTPVTFSATDSCGNEDAAAANVIIQIADNATPVVTAPTPDPLRVTALLCATSVTQSATADNFSGAIAEWLGTVSATDAEDGSLAVTHNAPLEFGLGSTPVTFTTSDNLGAAGEATATVQVVETPNTPPEVAAPTPDPLLITLPFGTSAGATVSATDARIAAWLTSAIATDAEDGALTVSHDAPADFPIGATLVTFRAMDSCGITAEATAAVTIEVQGNTTPVVTVPTPLTVDVPLCATSVPAADEPIAPWLASATATDAEDGGLLVSSDAPTDFPLGTRTVTFSATDGTGATATATSTVTVNDINSAPVVNAPATLSLTVAAGTASVPATDPQITAWLASASAIDAEDGMLSVTHDAPTDLPIGTTTVIFSATDSCGVITTTTSGVTIQLEAAVDLDIAQFQVGKAVRLAKPRPVDVKLVVRKNGTAEKDTVATVKGMQNGVEVYRETVTVATTALTRRSQVNFPDFTPSTAGLIAWTATIVDGDPDDDAATATTNVR